MQLQLARKPFAAAQAAKKRMQGDKGDHYLFAAAQAAKKTENALVTGRALFAAAQAAKKTWLRSAK